MNVRPATISDLDRCERLDATYSTGHVWQMAETMTRDQIAVAFRRVRLPRRLELEYPKPQDLLDHWRRKECFLAADEAGITVGYLDMLVQHEKWSGQIEHLVVHRPYRERGVAALLLEGAERWAQGSELHRITTIIQSKNDPALRLFAKRGYTFQGFINRYFRNGDIGLLYTLTL